MGLVTFSNGANAINLDLSEPLGSRPPPFLRNDGQYKGHVTISCIILKMGWGQSGILKCHHSECLRLFLGEKCVGKLTIDEPQENKLSPNGIKNVTRIKQNKTKPLKGQKLFRVQVNSCMSAFVLINGAFMRPKCHIRNAFWVLLHQSELLSDHVRTFLQPDWLKLAGIAC